METNDEWETRGCSILSKGQLRQEKTLDSQVNYKETTFLLIKIKTTYK